MVSTWQPLVRQLQQWLKVTRLVSKPRSIWPQLEHTFFISIAMTHWIGFQGTLGFTDSSQEDVGGSSQLRRNSVPQLCNICNAPKKSIFRTGRELLKLFNASLFSLRISVLKNPYIVETFKKHDQGQLVPSGAYHPYPRKWQKGQVISISEVYRKASTRICFSLWAQMALEELKRNLSWDSLRRGGLG